jgi:hypothetical protein
VSIEAPAGRTLPPGCLRQRPPSEREVQVKVNIQGSSLHLNLVLPLTLQLASLLEGGVTEGDGGSPTAPHLHLPSRVTAFGFCSSGLPIPLHFPLD